MVAKLSIGWNNRGYQLGTGIHSGWEMVYHWIKDRNIEELYWRQLELECPICDSPISSAKVPAPVSVVIFRCKNGHKFSYENTD